MFNIFKLCVCLSIMPYKLLHHNQVLCIKWIKCYKYNFSNPETMLGIKKSSILIVLILSHFVHGTEHSSGPWHSQVFFNSSLVWDRQSKLVRFGYFTSPRIIRFHKQKQFLRTVKIIQAYWKRSELFSPPFVRCKQDLSRFVEVCSR